MFTCKSCCDFAHRLSRTNAARWWTLQLPYSSRDGVRFRNPDALRRRPIRPDEPPRERRKVDDEFHDHLGERSEEHTSELQSLMRISYAVFCLKKKKTNTHKT